VPKYESIGLELIQSLLASVMGAVNGKHNEVWKERGRVFLAFFQRIVKD
jgi:hypothetical protein